jgi:hypothetical protein
MFYQGQTNTSCGCNQGCPQAMPTYQQCNQVVQTCNVQDIPHYTNFHTNVINNCIKRHINIPTYSTSQETVFIDQYVDGAPMYQAGMPGQMPSQNPMYGQIPSQGNQMGCGCGCGCQTQCMNTYNQQMMQQNPMQYQGNVGTEPSMMQQPMMYPGMNMPYNY